MKMCPVKFEIYDDAGDVIATFKAFDEESLRLEIKQATWTAAEFYELADAYELAIKQLKQGIKL